MSTEAMKQWLEALEKSEPKKSKGDDNWYEIGWMEHDEAITSLRQAIEQAEKQEPVAWLYEYWDDHHDAATGGQWRKNMTQLPIDLSNCRNVQPLYTHPQPKREPPTLREIKDVLRSTGMLTNTQAWEVAEALVELLAAHGIKENT
jgi:hypothetical protein